jgi:long-chain fatty acid transport protein
MNSKVLRWVAVGLFCGAAVNNAFAAGFQIYEQGGSGLGNAFAGAAASAEDATTLFYNPAGLSYLHGNEVAGMLHTIVPHAQFTNQGTRTVLGAPAIGGNGGDGGSPVIIPNMYLTSDMFGHGLTVGVGVNSPFGLKTEYDSDWVGRYQAIRSKLTTMNLLGGVSYRVNDLISIGGGINFMRANAELTNAIDFGAICVARLGGVCGGALVPGNLGAVRSDGLGVVEGDDWGVGYSLGLIVEPIAGTRLGAAFRSKVDVKLDGSASFSNPTLPGGLAALTAPFSNTSATAKLTMPEEASFSVFSQLTPHWALMADISWTNWSRFKELRVDFGNTLPDTVVQQQWNDSFRYSGGVTYTLNDAWKFRAGGAFDESPVANRFRTPRIPDADRTWVTFGINHRISSAGTIDLSYVHVFVDDGPIDKRGESDGSRLLGNFESSVDALSLQYTHQF